MGERPVRVELMTNRTGAADRRRIADGLHAGEVDIVVGTHVDLRRGRVRPPRRRRDRRAAPLRRRAARAAARNGEEPDVLVMTATPIPRTAAMLVYGDLDKSGCEMPPGRTPVTTEVVGPAPGAHHRVRAPAHRGRGGPAGVRRVPTRRGLAHRGKGRHRGARATRRRGARGLAPRSTARPAAGAGEGSRHGTFLGALDVLVATTVIEVGVDVPNATVMIVEDADRFGLSQLHQLRGRIERGGGESWCFLFADPSTPEAEAHGGRRDRPTASSRNATSRSAPVRCSASAKPGSATSSWDGSRDEPIVLEACGRRADPRRRPHLVEHAQLREEVEDLLGDAVEFLFKS